MRRYTGDFGTIRHAHLNANYFSLSELPKLKRTPFLRVRVALIFILIIGVFAFK